MQLFGGFLSLLNEEELHGPIFTAIAVMTQMEIESGCFLFDCEDESDW